MSRIPIRLSGNDTIDRYPLTYRRKLKKLLCISKEVFNKLKAALNEFGFRPKPASPKPKTPFRQKLSRKEPLRGAKNDDLKSDKDNYAGSFEPSNILDARNSLFWRLKQIRSFLALQYL